MSVSVCLCFLVFCASCFNMKKEFCWTCSVFYVQIFKGIVMIVVHTKERTGEKAGRRIDIHVENKQLASLHKISVGLIAAKAKHFNKSMKGHKSSLHQRVESRVSLRRTILCTCAKANRWQHTPLKQPQTISVSERKDSSCKAGCAQTWGFRRSCDPTLLHLVSYVIPIPAMCSPTITTDLITVIVANYPQKTDFCAACDWWSRRWRWFWVKHVDKLDPQCWKQHWKRF